MLCRDCVLNIQDRRMMNNVSCPFFNTITYSFVFIPCLRAQIDKSIKPPHHTEDILWHFVFSIQLFYIVLNNVSNNTWLERKLLRAWHTGLCCATCTLSTGLTVDVVTLSVSGLDTVELSEKREAASFGIRTITKYVVLSVRLWTQRLVYRGCSLSPRSAPGLLKHPSL